MSEVHFGYTFFDFLNAGKQEKLISEINAARNRLIVLVHPFYELTHATKEYEKVLRALLLKSKIPILILEEEAKIEQTRKRLQEMGVPEPFIIATVKNESHIIIGRIINNEIPEELLKIFKEDHSVKVINGNVVDQLGIFINWVIRKFGVKTVFVAGQQTLTGRDLKYEVTDPRLNSQLKLIRGLTESAEEKDFPHLKSDKIDIVYAGCAGGLYDTFRNLKEIEKARLIPNAIHPRKPIRRFVGRKMPK